MAGDAVYDVYANVIARLDKASKKKVEQQLKQLADNVEAKVQPVLDRARVKQVQAALAQAFRETPVKITVDLNRTSLNRVRAEIAQVLRDRPVKVAVDLNKTSALAVRAALARMFRDQPVKFVVDLDEASLGKLQAQLAAALQESEVDVGVDLDESSAKAAEATIDRVARDRDIEYLAKISEPAIKKVKAVLAFLTKNRVAEITTKLNNALRAKVQAQLDRLAQSRAAELAVKLRNSSVGKVSFALAKLARDRVVNISVNMRSRGAQLRKLAQELAVASGAARGFERALGPVNSAVARLSGGRLMHNLTNEVRDMVLNLDTSIPSIAKMSLMIANLGASALHALGGLLGLGSSLAKLGGLALPLPALLAAVGTSALILTFAFKDADKYIGDVQKKFASLRQVISGNFWAKAEEPIRRMANTLFPTLRSGLASASGAMGTFVAKMAGVLGSNLGKSTLGVFFSNLTKSINIAGTGIQSFTRGFLTLVKVGSGWLPNMSQGFNSVTAAFDKWVQKAAATGKINAMIRAAVDVARDLGRVLTNTVGILSGLANAANKAGAGGVKGLADALARINGIVNSPKFQTALVTLFQGADKAMAGLARALGPVGDAIAFLAPTLANIMTMAGNTVGAVISAIAKAISNPVFAKGLNDLFAGIQAGIGHLLPVLPIVADKFGKLGSLIGTMAGTFGKVGAAVIRFAAPLIDLIPKIQPIVVSLGDAFVKLLDKLAPVKAAFVGVIGSILDFINKNNLAPVIAGIALGFAGLLKAVGPVAAFFGRFGGIISKIAPKLAPLMQSLGGAGGAAKILGGALRALAGPVGIVIGLLVSAYASNEQFRGAVNGLVKVLGGGLLGIFKSLIGAISPVLGIIGGLAQQIMGALIPPLTSLINQLLPPLQGLFASIGPAIGALTPVIAGLAGILGGVLSGVIRALAPLVSTVFSVIGNVISNVLRVITGVIQVFTGVLTGNWSLAWSGLKNIVMGALQGIWAVVTGFFRILGALFKAGFNIIVAVVTGVVKLLVAPWVWLYNVLVGNSVIPDMIKAIVQVFQMGLSVLKAIVSAIVQGIVAVFNGLKALVVAIFQATVTGALVIWNALKAGVVAIVNGLRVLVTAYFNGLKVVLTAIFNAIRVVATAVWNGIKAVVTRAAQGTKALVVNTFNALKSVISSIFNGIRSIATSVWNSIKSALTNAANTAKNLVVAAFNALKSTVTGIFNGLVSAISGAIGKITGFFSGLGSKILGALSGIDLSGAGARLMGTLAAGVERTIGAVVGKVQAAANKIKSLLPGSPIKAGPLKSWNNGGAGKKLMELLAQGIAAGSKGVLSAAATIAKKIRESLAAKEISGAQANLALRVLSSGSTALARVADRRLAVAAKLRVAQERLSEAIKVRNEFWTNIRDNTRGLGDITKQGNTAEVIIANLQKRVAEAAEFRTLLTKLQASGLSQTALKQIADAGVEGGLASARALAEGGVGAIRQVNSLQGQLDKQAQMLATSTANMFYKSGVDAAQGLVNGLTSQEKKLAEAAKRIATGMTKAIKATLKISSPSKVFQDEVGKMMGLGIAEGIGLATPTIAQEMNRAVQPPGVPKTTGATTTHNATTNNVGGATINQNYYGPTTSSDRARELQWLQRFATKARQFGGDGVTAGAGAGV